jgi:cobalamin biosynthesis protein CbiG
VGGSVIAVTKVLIVLSVAVVGWIVMDLWLRGGGQPKKNKSVTATENAKNVTRKRVVLTISKITWKRNDKWCRVPHTKKLSPVDPSTVHNESLLHPGGQLLARNATNRRRDNQLSRALPPVRPLVVKIV